MMNMIFLSSHAQSDEFGFVNLNDSYLLGEEFSIVFQKTTHQPCPSYEISLMKEGIPESEIHYGAESLCAISGSVEPYLFSGTFEKPEFFDSIGTYSIKVMLDNETIHKKIKIIYPESHSAIPPPLKQFNAGVRIDKIQCNEPLQTILKTDGTPACVKLDSIEKLREYGWTNSKILSDELVREKLLELTGLLESGHVAEFNEIRTELVAFVLLERVDAVGMNLDGINLKYTSLPGANLHNATLKGANIGNADLSNANLQDANLEGANLSHTRLWGANLQGVNLQNAILDGASFRSADLSNADLQGSNLQNADLPITANLSNADLRNTKNLPISIDEAKERGAITD